MYLHELKLWNFRQYGSSGEGEIKLESPHLNVQFNKRLNLLVGENNSGKSSIIDAIKYVILTQSREWIKPEIEDFFVADHTDPDNTRAQRIRIECTFKTKEVEEAKNFLEWLKISKVNGEEVDYFLTVYLEAEIKNGKVYSEILAGAREDGTRLEVGARDLLRATYLMPLRDAESELTPKRGSRLSQILSSYKTFQNVEGQEHQIQEILKGANEDIREYFETDDEGKEVLSTINKHLSELIDLKKAQIDLSDPSLKSILEKLILNLGMLKEGLGSNNLLFIAAELLLLETGLKNASKVALIEEIEAHLHPQAQLRLIDYLQKADSFREVQFFLTTHSPNLASKVSLENLLICQNGYIFPMGHKYTQLKRDDYAFMERFLDVTKANLFFCRGLVLVEGDAENLFIPYFAKLLEIDFPKYGISVVNMGTLSFMRYSKIFLRNEEPYMELPVSNIRDLDVSRVLDSESQEVVQKDDTIDVEKEKLRLTEKYTNLNVKGHVSTTWTLEFELAQSCLRSFFYEAVLVAEELQKDDEKKFEDVYTEELKQRAEDKLQGYESDYDADTERVAYEIYAHKVLGRENPETGSGSTAVSKAVIAQSLVSILKSLSVERKTSLKGEILQDHYLKYLVCSLEHVTSKELWQGGRDGN